MWFSDELKAATATSAMSRGSMVAIGTSGNWSRTTSPLASWLFQRRALDMKVVGRRKDQPSPESRTACSVAAWYAEIAFVVSLPSSELLDSTTTCRTPAALEIGR